MAGLDSDSREDFDPLVCDNSSWEELLGGRWGNRSRSSSLLARLASRWPSRTSRLDCEFCVLGAANYWEGLPLWAGARLEIESEATPLSEWEGSLWAAETVPAEATPPRLVVAPLDLTQEL